ncbi:MAG: CPBP family intramembrane glutamic endopeptidase [Chloroflexota bacterium]
MPLNLSASALQFVCPLIAALILVYRESKADGVRTLLQRVFSHKTIRPRIWYVPIILLMPLIYLLSYVVMLLMRLPLPAPQISLLALPLFFVVFFATAASEEVGWSGYATDPMQDRWGALKASIIIGLVWSAWHIVPDIQAHHSPSWIVWHRLGAVAQRVLIVWLYNNTGRSVLATILFHDMDNVSVFSFPNDGSHYEPAVTGPITVIAALVVTFLWGAKTLARFRYGVRR